MREVWLLLEHGPQPSLPADFARKWSWEDGGGEEPRLAQGRQRMEQKAQAQIRGGNQACCAQRFLWRVFTV